MPVECLEWRDSSAICNQAQPAASAEPALQAGGRRFEPAPPIGAKAVLASVSAKRVASGVDRRLKGSERDVEGKRAKPPEGRITERPPPRSSTSSQAAGGAPKAVEISSSAWFSASLTCLPPTPRKPPSLCAPATACATVI